MTDLPSVTDHAKRIIRYLLGISDGPPRSADADADADEKAITAVVAACVAELLTRRVLGEPIDVAKAHELARRDLKNSNSPTWQVETMIRHFGGSLTSVHGLSREEVFDASIDAIDVLLDDAKMNSEELAQFEEEVLARVASRLEVLAGGADID